MKVTYPPGGGRGAPSARAPGRPYNPLPWSYSSLTSFETCPRRHHLTRVAKRVDDPMGPDARYGIEVHQAIEKYLKSATPLPARMAGYAGPPDALKAKPGELIVEKRLALTSDLQPTDYWGPHAWWRGAIDAGKIGATTAVLLDWKLGKPKNDDAQLSLFAMAAFAHYPQIERVAVGYVWLAHNSLSPMVFERAQAPAIAEAFRPRVINLVRAHEEGDYPPRPSGLCRKWCPVPNDMCEHSGAR